MKQIKINGILVAALNKYKNKVTITYNEANRLLTTYPKLDFIIYERITNKVISLENIKHFENYNTKFCIGNLMTIGTKDPDDIEDLIIEVGDECINSIKAHLKRLGWFEQYDEHARRIKLDRTGNTSIDDLYLDNEEVMIIADSAIRVQNLSSVLTNNQISVEDLKYVLEEIEKIDPLDIVVVKTP